MAKLWKKADQDLIKHSDSLETKPEDQHSYITPSKTFFVCTDLGGTPLIDPDSYRLRIEGDGLERSLEFSYEALLNLPSHTLIAYLECAGSQRQLFKEIMAKEAHSDSFAMTPWMLGGVGNAVWTGVSLKTLLELAGLKDEARFVNAKGLDTAAPEGGVSRPIGIDKAIMEDTMLAYFMNGEPLLPDHGYPVRLLVPGYIGANSIKWVGSITVSCEEIWVRRNTEHYVYIGPEWPAEQYAPAKGAAMAEQTIKSSLALPWHAEVSEGKQLLRGIARSPSACISKVEWSADEGATWQAARLLPPILKYAWVRFEFEWLAAAGEHKLMTRAYDEAGNCQPLDHPFNQEGYLFNRVYGHPVRVHQS